MQAQPMMLPHGDFALGMRAIALDSDASGTQGDFAAGMRATAQSHTIATFAAGQATKPLTPVIRGTFATGQSGESKLVPAPHPRSHRHSHEQSAGAAPATQASVS